MIVLESEDDSLQIVDISSPATEVSSPVTTSQDQDDLFSSVLIYQATLSDSWSNIMEVQAQLSESLAVTCLCTSHRSGDSMEVYANSTYDYTSLLSPTHFADLSGHEHHQHCRCGGHYKDGKCEECGRLEHND